MTYFLLTKTGLFKMKPSSDKAVELIRRWPSKEPILTANMTPHHVIVDLERGDPEFAKDDEPMPQDPVVMRRSPACDALVKKWEGYHKALRDGSCAAYPDVAHGWKVATIGFGTTFYQRSGKAKYGRTQVRQGDVLTRAEAEDELDAELDQVEEILAKAITAPVTQAMFDAMCSFAFNLGPGGAQKQIARINRGAYEECAAAFDQYINANGRPYQGLINRRNEEEALFRSQGLNPEGSKPKPDSNVATLRPIADQWHEGAWAGLRVLNLGIGSDTFRVASGARGAQTLRKPTDPRSVPGNLELIPQGRYRIGDIVFANGKDNYEGSFGAGLGPVWVPLDAEFSDDRGAFGFHLDSNIGSSPGSAGCVVFRELSDLKRFVAALRKYDPRILSVEYGL